MDVSEAHAYYSHTEEESLTKAATPLKSADASKKDVAKKMEKFSEFENTSDDDSEFDDDDDETDYRTFFAVPGPPPPLAVANSSRFSFVPSAIHGMHTLATLEGKDTKWQNGDLSIHVSLEANASSAKSLLSPQEAQSSTPHSASSHLNLDHHRAGKLTHKCISSKEVHAHATTSRTSENSEGLSREIRRAVLVEDEDGEEHEEDDDNSMKGPARSSSVAIVMMFGRRSNSTRDTSRSSGNEVGSGGGWSEGGSSQLKLRKEQNNTQREDNNNNTPSSSSFTQRTKRPPPIDLSFTTERNNNNNNASDTGVVGNGGYDGIDTCISPSACARATTTKRDDSSSKRGTDDKSNHYHYDCDFEGSKADEANTTKTAEGKENLLLASEKSPRGNEECELLLEGMCSGVKDKEKENESEDESPFFERHGSDGSNQTIAASPSSVKSKCLSIGSAATTANNKNTNKSQDTPWNGNGSKNDNNGGARAGAHSNQIFHDSYFPLTPTIVLERSPEEDQNNTNKNPTNPSNSSSCCSAFATSRRENELLGGRKQQQDRAAAATAAVTILDGAGNKVTEETLRNLETNERNHSTISYDANPDNSNKHFEFKEETSESKMLVSMDTSELSQQRENEQTGSGKQKNEQEENEKSDFVQFTWLEWIHRHSGSTHESLLPRTYDSKKSETAVCVNASTSSFCKKKENSTVSSSPQKEVFPQSRPKTAIVLAATFNNDNEDYNKPHESYMYPHTCPLGDEKENGEETARASSNNEDVHSEQDKCQEEGHCDNPLDHHHHHHHSRAVVVAARERRILGDSFPPPVSSFSSSFFSLNSSVETDDTAAALASCDISSSSFESTSSSLPSPHTSSELSLKGPSTNKGARVRAQKGLLFESILCVIDASTPSLGPPPIVPPPALVAAATTTREIRARTSHISLSPRAGEDSTKDETVPSLRPFARHSPFLTACSGSPAAPPPASSYVHPMLRSGKFGASSHDKNNNSSHTNNNTLTMGATSNNNINNNNNNSAEVLSVAFGSATTACAAACFSSSSSSSQFDKTKLSPPPSSPPATALGKIDNNNKNDEEKANRYSTHHTNEVNNNQWAPHPPFFIDSCYDSDGRLHIPPVTTSRSQLFVPFNLPNNSTKRSHTHLCTSQKINVVRQPQHHQQHTHPTGSGQVGGEGKNENISKPPNGNSSDIASVSLRACPKSQQGGYPKVAYCPPPVPPRSPLPYFTSPTILPPHSHGAPECACNTRSSRTFNEGAHDGNCGEQAKIGSSEESQSAPCVPFTRRPQSSAKAHDGVQPQTRAESCFLHVPTTNNKAEDGSDERREGDRYDHDHDDSFPIPLRDRRPTDGDDEELNNPQQEQHLNTLCASSSEGCGGTEDTDILIIDRIIANFSRLRPFREEEENVENRGGWVEGFDFSSSSSSYSFYSRRTSATTTSSDDDRSGSSDDDNYGTPSPVSFSSTRSSVHSGDERSGTFVSLFWHSTTDRPSREGSGVGLPTGQQRGIDNTIEETVTIGEGLVPPRIGVLRRREGSLMIRRRERRRNRDERVRRDGPNDDARCGLTSEDEDDDKEKKETEISRTYLNYF